MKAYYEYWVATMIRGLLAIVAGTGVLFIPQMASTILLLPFAIVVSILCLAAYGTIDSAIILTISFMIPPRQPGRVALAVQRICGAAIGILIFALVSERLQIHWFIYLAAAQAASAAIAEYVVARRTSSHHGARWCYASASVAAISSIALLLGKNLSSREVAWLIYGYLAVFGFNLFVVSARMLFATRELLHLPKAVPGD